MPIMDDPLRYLLAIRIKISKFPKIYYVFVQKWILRNHRLDKRQFMLFPSYFWPNKNHRMLLTAYNMFVNRNSEKELDLVLTESLKLKGDSLRGDIKKMGLVNRVHLITTDNKHNLAALWQGCSFLIFPSLEENCCLFFLEAMYCEKPNSLQFN